ncbi:hypothetical protein EJ08DRAFT_737192 [Tothia fuscella]|uniref:Uncharacterized protein n=1 Tax=Tothia fuscella TaxID=1048955 RepID=A0A9P4TUV6_9PEZI|nr:hypothetical protein EJ08DRAFT_737192 [Tothia fuscella]
MAPTPKKLNPEIEEFVPTGASVRGRQASTTERTLAGPSAPGLPATPSTAQPLPPPQVILYTPGTHMTQASGVVYASPVGQTADFPINHPMHGLRAHRSTNRLHPSDARFGESLAQELQWALEGWIPPTPAVLQHHPEHFGPDGQRVQAAQPAPQPLPEQVEAPTPRPQPLWVSQLSDYQLATAVQVFGRRAASHDIEIPTLTGAGEYDLDSVVPECTFNHTKHFKEPCFECDAFKELWEEFRARKMREGRGHGRKDATGSSRRDRGSGGAGAGAAGIAA